MKNFQGDDKNERKVFENPVKIPERKMSEIPVKSPEKKVFENPVKIPERKKVRQLSKLINEMKNDMKKQQSSFDLS